MDAVGRLRRKIGWQSLIYLVGEGVGKGLMYVVLVLLAALLPVEDFGYVNLFITMVGFLSVLVGLGLPDAVARFYFLDVPFSRVLGSTVMLVALAAIGVAALLLAAPGVVASFLHVPYPLLGLSVAGALVAALRQCWLEVMRAQQRSLSYATGRLAEPLAMIAMLTPVLGRADRIGYHGVLLAYVGSTAVVAIGGLAALSRYPGISLSLGPAEGLLRYSVPLIFNAVAMTGLATYDQIIVNQVLGIEATGVYAYAYRIGTSMSLVVVAFLSAWTPIVFEKFQKGEGGADLGQVAGTCVNVALTVAAVFCVVLPPVGLWVGGQRYREAIALIPIIVYGSVWVMLYGLAAVYLVCENRTLVVALNSGTAFAVNAVLNYWLVPLFGLRAAALSSVGCYALLFTLVWFEIRRRHDDVRFEGLVARVLAFSPIPVLTSRWFS